VDKVVVYKYADDKYMAMLFGGWYVAYGTTQTKAINSVLRLYEKEQEKYIG
jgi:hypothetical protein